MKVRIVDSQKNINRYMDILKRNEPDMDLRAMTAGDITFIPIECGYQKIQAMHGGLVLLNMAELRRYGNTCAMDFRNHIYLHGIVCFDIREDEIYTTYMQAK